MFDGSDDYVDLEDWEWGGTVSFELYVKWESVTQWHRLFDFGDGPADDNVVVSGYVSY